MEFGASSRVDSGANVIGLSWTCDSRDAESSYLVTTTDSRVAVHAADDLRLMSSFISRPGSQTKFTLAAVQNRATRRFYCVQDGDRLVSWHEKDVSMSQAVNVQLRGEAFALRTSLKVRLILVVYKDGGVSAFNLGLEEILYLPPTPGGAGTAVTWTRFARSATNDNRFILCTLRQPVASELGGAAAAAAAAAAAPKSTKKSRKGEASQSGASGGAGSPDAPEAPLPTMSVYTITVTRDKPQAQQQQQQQQPAGGKGGKGVQQQQQQQQAKPKPGGEPTETYAFKHVATHRFSPPVGAPAGSLVCSITLHKFLHALTLVWSSGHLQLLQHEHRDAWYATHPRQTVLRQLGRFLPSSDSSASPHAGPFACASFALEPSCIVLAGPADGGGGSPDVGLTVWDVRYGVVLGAKRLPGNGETGAASGGRDEDADDDEDASAAAAAAQPAPKRQRGSSKGPAASSAPAATPARHRTDSSASVGSLLSAALAASGGAGGATLTPDSAFQVTVDEHNSYVAVASRRRVILTPVAARGASLLSAVGKLDASRALLAAGARAGAAPEVPLAPSRSVPAVPIVNLSDAIRVATAGEGDGAEEEAESETGAQKLGGAVVSALTEALAAGTAAVDAAARSILDATATPTAADVLRALASGNGGKAAGSKRPRAGEDGADGAPALPATLPPALVSSCLYRAVSELKAAASPSSSSSSGAAFDTPLLVSTLLRRGLVSYGMCPELVPTLLAGLKAKAKAHAPAAAAAAAAGGKKGKGAAPASSAPSSGAPSHSRACLRLLACAAAHIRDLPEGLLARIFCASLHSARLGDLEDLWAQAQVAAPGSRALAALASASGSSGSPLPASQLGQLYLTGLLVACPRNDVFMEAALARGLPTDDALALLACLYRLLGAQASAHIPPAPASAGPSAYTVPAVTPTYGQVLDWVRMALDAHFPRLLLLARAPAASDSPSATSGPGVAGLLRELVAAIGQQSALCDSLAGLRGHVLHVLTRGPTPAPPPPDHIVEYVTL